MVAAIDNRKAGRPLGPPRTLRELRLWHWRKVVTHRAKAMRHEARDAAWHERHPQYPRPRGADARAEHRIADWHLTAVQTLNAYFPDPLDTAERDDSNGRITQDG